MLAEGHGRTVEAEGHLPEGLVLPVLLGELQETFRCRLRVFMVATPLREEKIPPKHQEIPVVTITDVQKYKDGRGGRGLFGIKRTYLHKNTLIVLINATGIGLERSGYISRREEAEDGGRPKDSDHPDRCDRHEFSNVTGYISQTSVVILITSHPILYTRDTTTVIPTPPHTIATTRTRHRGLY